jgi:ATP-dependent Lhr-like helicase
VAERLTARLNDQAEEDDLAQSHHGSLSLERRRATETALKSGGLRAVVATASLELGIDMGTVDLVCQVESPGSVARGLQRVGRAGHQVGGTSQGRLFAKTAGDLLESAALAKAMIAGEVECLRVPANCLDVLAQQVVACVAMDRWDVHDLFDLVRGAYPYRDLTAAAFESVLELVSGRYHVETFRDLRPRVSWDRVHDRLHPLPGTAKLALVGGGTIPDTGQFPLYLGADGPRLGELDEEFVHERRVGEAFVLGTATWRIEAIEPHRVIVSPAEGHSALTPFWRGETTSRTAELGAAVGRLCREIAGRLDDPRVEDWLRAECHLDAPSAHRLRGHIARQQRVAGAVPDDRTVLVETYRDPAGETGLAVLSPWGGKFHHALKLALQGSLRRRLGISVACLHGDEGVLIRLPQSDEPPTDVFRGLDADAAERLVRAELGESALFGLRFRQNAGRALLLPRPDPSRRTPLWLQRLRAKDLLQAVRQMPDFPIVVETYRECLDDDLDLPGLRRVLDEIASGAIRVVERRGEIPSPFASEQIFAFTARFIYEWDEPRRGEPARRSAAVSESLLDSLLDPDAYARWLDPAAIGRVEGRLRGVGHPPRTPDEMAERLRQLGDLTPSELAGPMAGFLADLEGQGRACRIELAGTVEPSRWIGTEDVPLYRDAFGGESANPETAARTKAIDGIIRRYLRTRALVTLDDLCARYPIDRLRAADLLERWAESGGLVRLDSEDDGPRWADRRNLDEVRRVAVALRRRESLAVTPEVFADFLLRRQHVHPANRLEGPAALGIVLDQLQGFAVSAEAWEAEILPRRVRGYRSGWLDEAIGSGGWTWRAHGDRVAIVPRGFVGGWPNDGVETPPPTAREEAVRNQLDRYGAQYVDELTRGVGLEPSQVRRALDALARRGLVTNDRFEPLRPSARARIEALEKVAAGPGFGARGRPRLGTFRRPASDRAEGRWARVAAGDVPAEDALRTWIGVLLDRYGVLTRETTALDSWAPPWRELFPVLDRAELRGEVRRGYFVEGLSGVQFALAETAEELAAQAGMATPDGTPALVSSLDPANLYGSGAPFDIDLLEGGMARLIRSASSFLVLIAGRPVLIIEGSGRRLTGLASASEEELRAALGVLPALAGPERRVLLVESYNNAAVLASPAAPGLAEAGFVRDLKGMAYYAGW